MPAQIPSYSRPLPQPGGTTWTPPPTALEGFGATVRDAFNRNIGRDESEGDAAYQTLIQPLVDMGQPMNRYIVPTIGGPVYNRQAIYADAIAARQKNAKMFASLPQTQAEYDKQWQGEFQADMAKDSAIINRTGWAPWLAGGIVGGMANPINLASLGAGGAGGGLMRVMAREALVNGVIAAADQPFQALESSAQGRNFTLGEAATNTVFGAAAGAVFGGALHGAGMGWEAAKPVAGAALNRVSDPFAQAIAKHWDRLPSALQDRWMATGKVDGLPITDSLIADTSEAMIGREFLAGHEAAAVGLLRREGQIDGASPFKSGGAGDDAHREALAEVISRIMTDQRGKAPVRQQLAAGTGLAGGSVMGDPVSMFTGRLAGVESGGNDLAQAATSSAFGRYQFTRGTWLTYFRQRFGQTGLSEAEILAKRANPAIQNAVMAHATTDYQAKLRAMGETITPGNLYVMHFAGEARARRLFEAEAGASAESVMGKAAVDANPFLRDMNVGDVLAWADRKMGGDGMVLRGPGPEIDPAAVPDPAMRDAMQAQVDAMRLDNARMRAEMGGQNASVSSAVENAAGIEPAAIEAEGLAPEAPPHMQDGAFTPEAPSVEVQAVLDPLRKIAADPGRKLNDIAGIARELGASEQDVRQGLMQMVIDGTISQRKDGRFARKAAAPSGPEDVLEFIARKGGIRDDEGHKLGLKTLSPQESARMISNEARARGVRNRATGSRDWKMMTRRNGPLLRHNGLSVDRVGEALHEAGYLDGADGGRPTTADVLTYLDQRIGDGRPRFAREDQGLAAAQAEAGKAMIDQQAAELAGQDISHWPTPDSRTDAERAFNAWGNFAPADQAALVKMLDQGGLAHGDVDPWIWQRTSELSDTFLNDHPMEVRQAFETAVDDYARNTMHDMYRETGDPGYNEADYEWHSQGPERGPQNIDYAEGGWGQPVDAGDPHARGAGGPIDAGGEAAGPALSDLPQAETTRFLDPEGEAAKAQADSLLHDAQMEAARIDLAIAKHSNLEISVSEVDYGYIYLKVDGAKGDLPYESPGGFDKFAGLAMADRGNRFEVKNIGLPDNLRGTGMALKLYERAAEYAFSKGKFLTSSETISEGAAQNYRKLASRYEVTEAPSRLASANEVGYPTNRLHNDAGDPIFTVKPRSPDNPMIDPAIAELQRQRAALQAAAPLRGENRTGQAQDGTMGLGLFDAADQPTFRMDAEGPEMSMPDLLKMLDEEQADIDTMRSCMVPMPKPKGE